MSERKILSGDEAAALAASASGLNLGAGYPGTPSTEILETLTKTGTAAEWAPNEKVALEVGIGVSFGGGSAIVTMKHVGLNVAADPLFTVAYTGVRGALVIVVADDPGMASSQNEQDNRNYAKAARVPMLEPSDSQESYDFMIRALELSHKFQRPVFLRMTTRVCHSKGIVNLWKTPAAPVKFGFENDVQHRVMIPAFAKKAHVALEAQLKEIAAGSDCESLAVVCGDLNSRKGVICSGISYQHVLDAAPDVKILKIGMTWPLPMAKIKGFADSVDSCIVVEEGDRFLAENIRSAGIMVTPKADVFLQGELTVSRVKKLLAGDETPEPAGAPGRPPALCPGCPHRKSYEALRDLGCIVSGDIGCYTLGVLPPFSSVHFSTCMGASIGMGLGLRRSLKEEDARKVVSVIGDSTFMHSGLTGIAEMVYNRPATGHLVIILDNRTTAMTGLQEHPATGRKIDMSEAYQVDIEAVVRAMGVDNVDVIDATTEHEKFVETVKARLASNDVSVIISRRPCILEIKKLAKLAKKEEGAK